MASRAGSFLKSFKVLYGHHLIDLTNSEEGEKEGKGRGHLSPSKVNGEGEPVGELATIRPEKQ